MPRVIKTQRETEAQISPEEFLCFLWFSRSVDGSTKDAEGVKTQREQRRGEAQKEISVFSVAFLCLLWFLPSTCVNLCQSLDFFCVICGFFLVG